MLSTAELRVAEQYERAADFTRWAQLLLRSQSTLDAARRAEQERCSPRLQAITKAAANALQLGGDGAEPLVDLQIVSSGFVSGLARQGVFDRMLSDTRRIPLATAGIRISTVATTGNAVNEGAAKPVTSLSFTGLTMPRLKSSCIIVATQEFVDALNAGSAAMLSSELRKGVIAATDTLFLSEMADGISVLPSAGATAANVLADLEDLLDAVAVDASARLYLVVAPAVAKRLTTKATTTGARAFPDMTPNGGTIAGITTLVSDHLPALGSPDGCVMLVDASQIAADSEVVVLDQARHASIQMLTDPTNSAGIGDSPSTAVATELVSMWQVGARGLRAERFYGFKRLRDAAVAVLDGGAW